MLDRTIYLDYASATPVLPEVGDAMRPYFTNFFYNPSALYKEARQVANAVDGARVAVAHHLGVKKEEIIFTSGATEANNLAVAGVLSRFPNASVLFSAIEHDSVVHTGEQYHHGIIAVQPDGRLDLDDLLEKLTDTVVIVSVMYANNEIGTIQDLKAIARIIAAARQTRKERGNTLPLYFHTDATQAPSYLDLHVHGLGVDMMTINSGKIYGPKGVGALYVNRTIRLQPLLSGGGQEKGVRSGTENVAGIIGFSKALDIVQNDRNNEVDRLSELQHDLFQKLEALGCKINGSVHHRLVNNIHVTFDGEDNERLLYALDQKNIQLATGSACSASSDEPSHVLKAIGLRDEQARASLRITLGRYTTSDDLDYFVTTLQDILR